ncbi:MAG TPA: nickel pincer cofactor biosynthesis protein LarC [Candidatus Eisenbacteria bacterium]|nr:nickel pincer cofactor biosynthesis protein LarC [Candidatus Eisenbacteria bacterium]
MRIAYFDCFSGVSGDMCLAALVSAGWPAADLQALPARLGLSGARITVGEARRGPFVATRVEVEAEGKHPHRHLKHVVEMIDAGSLDAAVKAKARAVFERLADAEAEVHGSTREKVHFHEVGAVDALIDVVGTIEGLHALGVEEVYASPLRLGRGAVRSEHGLIPVPAPATTLLLRGAPVEMPDIEAELVTPTGAALLTTLVRHWSSEPAFRLDKVGTGAGGRDLKEQPNVLRVLIGEAADRGLARREVAVLETALDDDNPQFVAALLPRLLAQGARDAMIVPTVMKKGRPGMWLVVVAEPEQAPSLAALLMRESSALGVRVRRELRYELERRQIEVETRFGRVALKVAELPEGGERALPEFESVREAAERAGRPLREVSEAALAAWRAGGAKVS